MNGFNRLIHEELKAYQHFFVCLRAKATHHLPLQRVTVFIACAHVNIRRVLVNFNVIDKRSPIVFFGFSKLKPGANILYRYRLKQRASKLIILFKES